MDKRIIATILFIILGFSLFLWALPQYKVYARELSGKAELREAEWNKKIQIEEAIAEKEAATLRKETEIIRAEGIAEANKIIADSISENYIRYKFIEGLNDGNTEVIYVPTEANLPILEAKRLQ